VRISRQDKRPPRRKVALTVKWLLLIAVATIAWVIALREFPLSIGPLAFRLKFGNPTVRTRAAKDLVDADSSFFVDKSLVLEVLGEGLLDKPHRRARAVSMLRDLDRRLWEGVYRGSSTWPLPEEALPVLIQALKDAAGDVRETAAQVLGGYGAIAAPAIPSLTVALDDWSPDVQREAMGALLKIGPEAKAAVPALRELRGHRDESVAATAANALRKLDPRD